jgi:hypothetical protein
MSEITNVTDNLEIYNRVRAVPPEAQKPIEGGRLKGKTDISPMWRIKMLTEQFGPVGVGWRYEVVKMWTEQSEDDTIAAFANINLYIKYNGEWSEAIFGTGGSIFKEMQKSGVYTNDECFKMALTDALSVSCKALGMAADVYWDKDRTKYNLNDDIGDSADPTVPLDPAPPPKENPTPAGDLPVSAPTSPAKGLTAKQLNRLHAIRKSVGVDEPTLKKIMLKHFRKDKSEELTRTEYDFICSQLEAMQKQNTA